MPAHLAHGDYAIGEPCFDGTGQCRSEGVTQCVPGGPVCTASAGEPAEEVCDGLDDDCDGIVDNDPADLGECTAGVGECAVDAAEFCEDGAVGCTAVAAPAPEDPEVTCNDGRDNDCDGTIDTADEDCCIPDPVCVDTCNVDPYGFVLGACVINGGDVFVCQELAENCELLGDECCPQVCQPFECLD